MTNTGSSSSKITWYFDFISPFAYLQMSLLPRYFDINSITLKPILFAGVLNHLKHKGPAEIDSKRKFTYEFITWCADKNRIPIKFPPSHPFNPLKGLRLAIALNSFESTQTIFNFIWEKGLCFDNAENWQSLLRSLDIDDYDTLLKQTLAKIALRENTEKAIAKNVFGVPTLEINNQMFWGHDATEMAYDFFNHAEIFSSLQMNALKNINQSAHR